MEKKRNFPRTKRQSRFRELFTDETTEEKHKTKTEKRQTLLSHFMRAPLNTAFASWAPFIKIIIIIIIVIIIITIIIIIIIIIIMVLRSFLMNLKKL